MHLFSDLIFLDQTTQYFHLSRWPGDGATLAFTILHEFIGHWASVAMVFVFQKRWFSSLGVKKAGVSLQLLDEPSLCVHVPPDSLPVFHFATLTRSHQRASCWSTSKGRRRRSCQTSAGKYKENSYVPDFTSGRRGGKIQFFVGVKGV